MSLNHYTSISDSMAYQSYRVEVGRPLTDTVSNTGVWLTLTFTVERYIAVRYPMKGKVTQDKSHDLLPFFIFVQRTDPTGPIATHLVVVLRVIRVMIYKEMPINAPSFHMCNISAPLVLLIIIIIIIIIIIVSVY